MGMRAICCSRPGWEERRGGPGGRGVGAEGLRGGGLADHGEDDAGGRVGDVDGDLPFPVSGGEVGGDLEADDGEAGEAGQAGVKSGDGVAAGGPKSMP